MPHANMLEADLTALVVIDVQEKMLSAISSSQPEALVARMAVLVKTARLLDVPVIFTEQYPRGLGSTDAGLAETLAGATGPLEKSTCSCWRDEGFRAALQATEREHVILCGVETHVCIQQTALDLLRVDYVPFVPADAVGSRRPVDYQMGLDRMRSAGVVVSTVESLMFELIERCDHPRFKEFLKLVK